MSIFRVGVLAVTLAACANDYAGDGAYLEGAGGSGALIRGRYFAHTTCAANDDGDLRCFSSCNPVIYQMGNDLSTVERLAAPAGACDGSLDREGNVTFASDEDIVITHADGSFTTVGALPIAPTPDAPLPVRAISRAGHVALVDTAHRLSVYAVDSGSLLWARNQQSFRAIAMQSDGGVVALGASSLVAYAPDGTLRWTHVGESDAIATGPDGQIAVATRTSSDTLDLQLLEPNGDVQWKRAIKTADNVSVDLAVDDDDIFVAAFGFVDPIVVQGYDGSLSRESRNATAWSTTLVGKSPISRILAVTSEAVILQLEVSAASTDQDLYMPEDHATTGIGDAILVTQGAGQLIAKIGR